MHPIVFEPTTSELVPETAPVRAHPTPGRTRRVALALLLAVASAGAGGAAGAVITSATDASDGRPGGGASATTAADRSSEPAASTPLPASVDQETAVVRAIEAVQPATVTIVVAGAGGAGGSGSGVIVDPRGWILTNRHVVNGADPVAVQLTDGRELEGDVHAIDTLTDLAIVKVQGSDLPSVDLGDSSAVRIGQTAIALGTPLGEFAGSASVGIVSGLDRDVTVSDANAQNTERLTHLIQTDAAINPGNSGGPLIDSSGRVIGINTAASGEAEGIGFAIPIDVARPIVQQAIAGEPVARAWLGISSVEVTAALAEEEDLPVDEGAWLQAGEGRSAVVEGSPAEAAGLRDGDVITAVDGEPVDRERSLDLHLLDHGPGDEVVLTVVRGSETLELRVTLGTRPADLR
jgi:2-alkenal reductase